MLTISWLLAGVTPVHAQQTDEIILQTAIPPSFDKGRNVSVTERARPDYDALGLQVGGFNVFPSLTTGVGYNSNIFLGQSDKVDDGYAVLAPAITANSDWGLHEVRLRGSGQFRRFFNNPRRNEDSWNVGALGRLDVNPRYSVTAEGQILQQYESPFSGEIDSSLTAISRYTAYYASIKNVIQSGQGRITLVADDTLYRFSDLPLTDGSFRSQEERDRNVLRLTGQVEYAFTPSLAAYAQTTFSDINYRTRLSTNVDNRDSQGIRIVGGVNFDLSGLMRGTIAAGFTRRDFNSSIYRDVTGFSFLGKLEYFPSELTTVGVTVGREIQDSTIFNSPAFYDNRFRLRVDHELLRNFLLNATADAAYQDYLEGGGDAEIYRIAGGGRYLLSPLLALESQLAYTERYAHQLTVNTHYNELRAQISLILHR